MPPLAVSSTEELQRADEVPGVSGVVLIKVPPSSVATLPAVQLQRGGNVHLFAPPMIVTALVPVLIVLPVKVMFPSSMVRLLAGREPLTLTVKGPVASVPAEKNTSLLVM